MGWEFRRIPTGKHAKTHIVGGGAGEDSQRAGAGIHGRSSDKAHSQGRSGQPPGSHTPASCNEQQAQKTGRYRQPVPPRPQRSGSVINLSEERSKLGEIIQLLLPQRAQHREPPARPQPPPETAHERYRQPSNQPGQRQCDPAEPAEPQWLRTQPRCAA